MSDMLQMDDFRKPDKSLDWDAYKKAQRARGDTCYLCGGHITSFGPGHMQSCLSCRLLDKDKGDVTHDTRVRCPKCKHQFPAIGDDDYDNYSEGSHDVTCPECEHEFEIETMVSYSFRSPELLPEEPEKEEPEEEDEDDDGEEKRPVEEVPPPGPEAPGPGEGAQPGA